MQGWREPVLIGLVTALAFLLINHVAVWWLNAIGAFLWATLTAYIALEKVMRKR